MKPRILPEKIISSLGRNLQILCRNRFSESHLNRILKLILDNLNSGNSFNKKWPADTMLFPYSIHLFSSLNQKDFFEFQNTICNNFKIKDPLIILDIIPDESTEKMTILSGDPEMLFKSLESLVFYIKNGVQIYKIDKLFIHNKDLTGKTSGNILLKLISDIINAINSSAFIISDGSQFKDNQCIITGLNKFLMKIIR
jgi:hypothetical protein